MFAVVGMSLFGKDGCGFEGNNDVSKCEDYMDKVNFSNFPRSINLLFRVATGKIFQNMSRSAENINAEPFRQT